MGKRRRDEMVSHDTFEDEEEEEARQQEFFRAIQHEENEIIRKVLQTWEGRHLLFNFIGLGDIYDLRGRTPFGEEGQRDLGRKEMALDMLKTLLHVDPNCYILMQQEAEEFERDMMVKFNDEGSDDE